MKEDFAYYKKKKKIGDHNNLAPRLDTALPCKAKEVIVCRHPDEHPTTCWCSTRLWRWWSSWQQQNHAAQHAPHSMHHGFPHKDWHHSCACMMSTLRKSSYIWHKQKQICALRSDLIFDIYNIFFQRADKDSQSQKSGESFFFFFFTLLMKVE